MPAGLRTARSVRRAMLAYGLSAGLTLAVVWVAAVVAADYIATAEALRDARTTADRLGRMVVVPLLLDADTPVALDNVDQAVALRRQDGWLIGVDVWRRDGVVVYSDRRESVGRSFPVPPSAVAAIDGGVVTARIAEQPEPGPLRGLGRLIEVAEPVSLPDRTTMALVAYLDYERIERTGHLLVGEITPLAIGAPLLLQLLQLPILLRLGRRLVRQEAERSTLLERALSASERERRKIAGDLHDGVLQQLAGAGLVVASLPPWIAEPGRAAAAERAAGTITAQVDALRRLAVSIYPPNLSAPGLPAAIEALARPLRDDGVQVVVEARPLPDLDPAIAAALYRVARECLSNVVRHASATLVQVCLQPDPDGASVSLSVVDDGVGMPERAAVDDTGGQLGLRLLVDGVADLGGELRVRSHRPGGTVVEVTLPRQPGGATWPGSLDLRMS